MSASAAVDAQAPAAYLALEDGTVLGGRSVGAPGVAYGEAVFTTGMSGYQEVATDPSFAEQIVAFTAPMVGNYGVADERGESDRAWARGIVMRALGGRAWADWLAEHGVVALDGIDTRSLVLRLREEGAMRAALVADGTKVEEILDAVRARPSMAGLGLVAGVSRRETARVGSGPVHVAVLDYGCKRSIVERLCRAGAQVTILPHDAPAEAVLEEQPDGVLLSNGPGDPSVLVDEVATVRELVGRVPLLGICLGHQLLGQAVGLSTYKLPFGHRGANHPVQDLRSGRVLVTTQNHGFAVAGDGPEVSHVSLYDGTVEGIELPAERARSVQFHPEAGPGPHDAWPIVAEWVDELTQQDRRAA